MKQITLEDVEKFIGADDYAVEEGEEQVVEARLEIRNIVEDICDRKMSVGVNSERDRVLRLWYAFHTSMKDMDLANALRTMGQAQQASLQLGYAIATGVDPRSVDLADVSVNTDVAESDHSLNRKLLIGIVKLMSKAGTRIDGAKAHWALSEITYGISVAMPDVGEEALGEAMKYLVDQMVVHKSQPGKCISSVYVLTDNYKQLMESLGLDIGEPVAEKIDEHQWMVKDLREILQSNRDIGGKLLPWSMNSLVFALRDKYKWICSDDIEAAVLEIEECRQVGDKSYLWTKETVVPVDAVFVPVHGLTREKFVQKIANPEKYNESKSSKMSIGVVEAADAIYETLISDVVNKSRIWKEYEIAGLAGRYTGPGTKLKKEHVRPAIMLAAIDFLVAEKKLEVVLPGVERPWLKQQGWRVVR